ncbi:MAG: hypothetical protein JNN05_06915 [Candidatus Omnitrophica bacterium]|nr:hypothetical protein [Candidatus Omnitrophota bacterium]
MSDLSQQPFNHAADSSKLMIDKAVVIEALEKLIADYPSQSIPRSVLRQTLMKVVGASDFNDLSGHPALQKLDTVLQKAKSEYL